jgi:hypothetical protein
MFQLMSWYSGPIFTARRSSDNVQADFYARADGKYWTTADNSGQQIAAWLNGSTAYCSKWYDQSGSGRHAAQSDNSLQPIIEKSNALMDFNSNGAYAYFNLDPGTVPQVVAYTVTVNHGVINNAMGGWLGGGVTTSNQCNNFRRHFGGYVNYWWSNDLLGGSYVPGNTITFKYDGTSTLYMYTNSVNPIWRRQISGWNGQAGNEFLGKTITASDGPFNGKIYFLYIYKTALSDEDRTMMETGAFGK